MKNISSKLSLVLLLFLGCSVSSCSSSDSSTKPLLSLGDYTIEFDDEQYSYSNSKGVLSPGISVIKDYLIYVVKPNKIGKKVFDNANIQIQFTESGDTDYKPINLARFLLLLGDKKPHIGVQMSIRSPDGFAVVFYDVWEKQETAVRVEKVGDEYYIRTKEPLLLRKGKLSGMFNRDMPREIKLSFELSTENALKLL